MKPTAGAKLYIEPGAYDAQHDRGEHPKAPPMPRVRIQAQVHFTHEGRKEEVHDGRLIWDFRIKGNYRVRDHGAAHGYRLQPYDLPGGRFSTTPGETIEVLLAPAEVVGGDLEVYAQYEAAANSPHAGIKVAQVVPCGEILGHNPARTDLHAFIIAQSAFRRTEHARAGADYGDLAWLFFRLFAHESTQRQFNPAAKPGKHSSTAEKPNYGDPAGVGIGQRDAEEGEWHFRAGGPQANLQFANEFWPRIFWNWKENVIAGMEAFYAKLASARHRLYGWAGRTRAKNPRAHVPDPPDGIVIREAIRNYNGGTEYQLEESNGHWEWVKSPMLGKHPYPTSSANYTYPDVVLGMAESDPSCIPSTGQYGVPHDVRLARFP